MIFFSGLDENVIILVPCNSSDRKFDTKLISILYAYMVNLKYFINTQLNLIENSSKELQKLTLWRFFALFV